mmetsp:Transcript_8580/g.21132  ORF Transcript_8580/g.21132 Transcript_8580/m.21132 type:complete len:189 (-) Transcript_8580:250-816(-)
MLISGGLWGGSSLRQAAEAAEMMRQLAMAATLMAAATMREEFHCCNCAKQGLDGAWAKVIVRTCNSCMLRRSERQGAALPARAAYERLQGDENNARQAAEEPAQGVALRLRSRAGGRAARQAAAAESSSAATGPNNGSECVICMDAPSSVTFLPCSHKCICESCSTQFHIGGECPVCRGRIRGVVTSF